eukprot:UN00600
MIVKVIAICLALFDHIRISFEKYAIFLFLFFILQLFEPKLSLSSFFPTKSPFHLIRLCIFPTFPIIQLQLTFYLSFCCIIHQYV